MVTAGVQHRSYCLLDQKGFFLGKDRAFLKKIFFLLLSIMSVHCCPFSHNKPYYLVKNLILVFVGSLNLNEVLGFAKLNEQSKLQI